MRPIIRVWLGVGVVSVVLMLPGLVSPAFGSTPAFKLGPVASRVKPTIASNDEASFVIPSKPSGEWVIRLWAYPTLPPAPGGILEGQTFGTSGTITVAIPSTSSCDFQVDVRVGPAGGTNPKDFQWYSGLIANVPDCGGNGG